MRNMFKKVVSLLLTIMMVLSLFTIVPLTTSAEEETTAPVVTAKALYKSHKIEWSTDNTAKESFTISTANDSDIKNKYTTDFVVGTKHYYTAILPLSTGLAAGTEYTVTKSDGTVIGKATVADITGREALIKNAAFSVDYGTTGKNFATEAVEAYTDPVLVAKLKSLKTGSLLMSAKNASGASTNRAIIAFTQNADIWWGSRGNTANHFGGILTEKWKMGQTDFTWTTSQKTSIVQIGPACDGTSVKYKLAPTDAGGVYTFPNGTGGAFLSSTANGTVAGVYVGGAGNGSLKWNGTIYYVVVSEEDYTEAELLAITKERVKLNITGDIEGANHKLTWNASSADYIITANGTKVENATITESNGTYTATIKSTSKEAVTYYVTNTTGTTTGSVIVTPNDTPNGLTAKALYKSHKIEWNTIYSDATFTITRNGETINKAQTKIQIGDLYYYTVIIEDTVTKTGNGKGTVYTVTSSTNNSATATVTENTGLDALRKNALLSVNYLDTEPNGYKAFNGSNNAVKLDNITDIQLQKIKASANGTWLTSAYYNNTNATAILSFGTVSGAQENWTGIKGNNFYQKSASKERSGNTVTANQDHSVVFTFNNNVVKMSIDGGDAQSKGDGVAVANIEAITKDTFYVGGIYFPNKTPYGVFNGNIYYAIFSEEVYTDAEIKLLSQTPYGALQTAITNAKNYIADYKVKNDSNYRTLQSVIAEYSDYTASTNVKDCFKAITTLENNISALNFRDTYNGSVITPIDKGLLKKNAKDNNHAQGSEVKDSNDTIIGYNDGKAEQLFDNNLSSKWHSKYGDVGKGKSADVGESNIVWMQTGFDGATRYITGIECTPRTDLIDQIKKYKVYVSNSATAPNVDTSADGSSEWKLVKEGEFTTACQKVGETQFISLDGKHEAKWVRLVVTSVYERDYGAHFLAIAEMDIYEAVNETPIDIQLLKDNAKDNNHANGSGGKDGVSAQLFDGKSDTFWHSNYDNTGEGLSRSVNEENPIWMQTGFGGATKYISKIEAYTRTGSINNQLKKYAIYVSTSENAPDVNTSVVDSDEWTFVCGDELKAFTTIYQMHTIKFAPVEAKWVRLVAYTTSSGNLLAMSEMKIYEVNNANVAISRYANEIENKLVEAEQILARENLCINDAYNNLVTICQNYKTYDLAAHDSANDLKYIQDNIDAISIALSSNETAVDKTLLANNADANSWVEDWHNHDAKALFDGNNIDCWHSRYGADNNGKTKKGSAFTEGGNVWIQTGFGGEISKSITKITVTPRGDINADNIYNGSGQVKDYKIYVSNANSKPDIDTNVTATNSGWIFVKEGSFVYNATATQSIQFEKPVEAKWIRLVILTTSDNATKNSSHASIGEMEIYEIDSCTHKAEVISNDIQNQVNEAKKLILKAGIDATELNKQIAELSNYTELLKTCDATQLQEKLTAISQKITTSGENEKSFNKDTENLNSFANDSVKWNNTEERLQTLRNNAKASITENNKNVTCVFDGNYHTTDNLTEDFYGSWVSGASTPAEITTGFGETVCVSGVVVFDRKSSNSSQNPLNSYKVLVSNDADFSSYLVAAEGSRNGNTTYSASGYVIKFDRPYNCKYIKVISTDNAFPADIKIVEMDIYEYVGKAQEVELIVTSVAENCTDINVADKIGKALTLNRKYSDKFTQDEVNEQLLSQGISLNDLAHNYTISVNDSGNIEVAVNKARYTLDVYNKGSKVYTQTEDYNGVFEKQIEGCTAWKLGDSTTGSIICTGDTFNYRATGDITVYAVTENISSEISVYIPEPIVSYNNSETVVEIPVYIIGTRNLVEKGIVFVMGNTGTVTTEDINKYILKEKFNDNIYSFSSKVGLTNRGRYIQKLNTSGKWPNGTFYGYIITKDANNNNIVTLSQAREYSGI